MLWFPLCQMAYPCPQYATDESKTQPVLYYFVWQHIKQTMLSKDKTYFSSISATETVRVNEKMTDFSCINTSGNYSKCCA